MAQESTPSRNPSEQRLAFEAPIYEMEARLVGDGGTLRQEPQWRAILPKSPSRFAGSDANWPRSSVRSTPTSTPGRSSRSHGTSNGPKLATTST